MPDVMLETTPFLIFLASLMTISVCNDVISDVIVTTRYGKLRGNRLRRDYGLGSDAVTTVTDRFLGVPYAKPPTAQRRFQAPVRPDSWGSAVRDAVEHGPACPQMVWGFDARLSRQDEDCLFLDIYSPYQETSRNAVAYPVMVYIHGGSYEVGTGRLIDGSVLAQLGVVLVSINYRLGALGFLTSGDSSLPGNYGLLDQVEALRWVHSNIHVFRGDADRVTIFGHSVGAASVGLMMIIPQAEGLFRAVISESGVATAPYSVHNPADGTVNFTDYVVSVGRLFDCKFQRDLESVISCLRLVPWREIVNERHKFPLFHPINPEFRPVVDGHVITDLPIQLFKIGKFQRSPFIIGTVRDEFGNYFSGGERYREEFDEALDGYVKSYLHGDERLFEILKFQYNDWANKSTKYEYQRGDVLSDMHMFAPTVEMANIVAQHSTNIYQYHFSTPGSSYHSIELNYVFGAPYSGIFADEMTVNGSVDKFSVTEKQLSLDVMKLWTSFARTGNPVTTGDSVQQWQPYTVHNRQYMKLSADGSTMERKLRANYAAFWNDLLPSLMANGRSSRTTGISPIASVSTVIGMWTLLAMTLALLVLVAVLTVLLVRREVVARRRRRHGLAVVTSTGKSSTNCTNAK